MKKPQPKPTEPSPRAKLSRAFLEALQSDFEQYGRNVIERMRETDPTRYAELAGKLIMTTEPPSRIDFTAAQTPEDVARLCLKAIGYENPTDADVEEAAKHNEIFAAHLEAIRAKAEGEMN
jgi:hypothetical protein